MLNCFIDRRPVLDGLVKPLRMVQIKCTFLPPDSHLPEQSIICDLLYQAFKDTHVDWGIGTRKPFLSVLNLFIHSSFIPSVCSLELNIILFSLLHPDVILKLLINPDPCCDVKIVAFCDRTLGFKAWSYQKHKSFGQKAVCRKCRYSSDAFE